MIMKTKLYTKVNILLLINALFLISGCAFHVNHETALLENSTKQQFQRQHLRPILRKASKHKTAFRPLSAIAQRNSTR